MQVITASSLPIKHARWISDMKVIILHVLNENLNNISKRKSQFGKTDVIFDFRACKHLNYRKNISGIRKDFCWAVYVIIFKKLFLNC